MMMSGSAAPIPKTTMMTATCPRFSLRAAITEAAPKVGPTQGVQTMPRNSPSTNWPLSPAVEKSLSRVSAQLPTGPSAAST